MENNRSSFLPNDALLYLTPPIDVSLAHRLYGKKGAHMKNLARLLGSPPLLFVSTDNDQTRLALSESALKDKAQNRPHIQSTLSLALSWLIELAQTHDVLSTDNITMAAHLAQEAVENPTKRLVRHDPQGATIDLIQVSVPELRDSRVFNPFLTTDARPSATTNYSETLFLNEEGQRFYNRMIGKDDLFLNKIKTKFPDLAFRTNKTARDHFSIEGQKDKVIHARNALIRFGNYLYQHSYETPELVDLALSVALGDKIERDLVPQDSPAAKKLAAALKRAPLVNGVKFSLADLHLNLVTPRTENQSHFMDMLRDPSLPFVFCLGPAGVGKTRMALQEGLASLRAYARGKTDMPLTKLMISIPMTTVGNAKMGAVPGDHEQKAKKWFDPFYDVLQEILAPPSPLGDGLDIEAGQKTLHRLVELKVIQPLPLEFMRGRNFSDSFIVLDEAQNAQRTQIKTALTRVKESSRFVMMGDVMQQDLVPSVGAKGEWIVAPSCVSITEAGRLLLKREKKDINLGFYRDVVDAHVSKDGILESLCPRNGLTEATLLFGAHPRFGLVVLTHEDSQRHGLTGEMLRIYDSVRLPFDPTSHNVPAGKGTFDLDAVSRAFQTKRAATLLKHAP